MLSKHITFSASCLAVTTHRGSRLQFSPKGLSATQKVFFVVLKHRVPRRNFKQERIQEWLARLWKGSIRILQEGFFFFFLKSVLNKWESRQRRRSLPVTLNEVLRIILAGDSALRLNVVRYLKANCTVYSHLHSVHNLLLWSDVQASSFKGFVTTQVLCCNRI